MQRSSLAKSQSWALRHLGQAAPRHRKICLEVPRRWGKTHLAGVINGDPSLLGRVVFVYRIT